MQLPAKVATTLLIQERALYRNLYSFIFVYFNVLNVPSLAPLTSMRFNSNEMFSRSALPVIGSLEICLLDKSQLVFINFVINSI